MTIPAVFSGALWSVAPSGAPVAVVQTLLQKRLLIEPEGGLGILFALCLVWDSFEHFYTTTTAHYTFSQALRSTHWRCWYLQKYCLFCCDFVSSLQAQDVNITSGWRRTWRRTDFAFWLRMKIWSTSFDANLTLT